MKKMNSALYVLVYALSGWLIAADLSSGADRAKLPRFEMYPVEQEVAGKRAAKLVLSSKLARQYKTVITAEAKREPDFAGHFRVATWGCGTDCRGFAIVDQHTGVVYTLPGVDYVAGVMGNGDDRLSYRLDSRLFIITGSKNDEEEGKFYYLWSGKSLSLLHKGEVPREAAN
jgi:hypothetical protein